MDNTRIIIADSDKKYIRTLETKFLEDFRGTANLEIITDKEYLDNLFSKPQNINVLIIEEKLYSDIISKHNIDYIFILQENERVYSSESNIRNLYKFSSANSILREVRSVLGENMTIRESPKKTSRILTITSACGGVGKTTISMGLAVNLSMRKYRVLYINAEKLHTFQEWFLNDVETDARFYNLFLKEASGIYEKVKKYLQKDNFSYLPAFKSALCNIGISTSIYQILIKEAKECGDFDIIIVDTDSILDKDKGALMSLSDILLIIVNQSKSTLKATDIFINNIQTSSIDKCIFVCNNFIDNDTNKKNLDDYNYSFHVTDYIEHIRNTSDLKLKDLQHNKDFLKLSYLVGD